MQLFLLGIHLPKSVIDFAEARTKEMDIVFPTLSMDTYWSYRRDGKILLITVNHPSDTTQPRCYRFVDESQVVFYDGVFIDSQGEFRPNQATVLAKDWNGAMDRIEGQFVAVRFDKKTNRLEVFSDHMGFYNLFACEYAGGWLVSNSIRLLTRIRKRFELDPVGVAMTLSYGIAFGDFTLQEGIRNIPGGKLVSFECESGQIQERPYFDRMKWSAPKKRPFGDMNINELAEKLARPLAKLAEDYGPLEAPITAGQDSRVILALLRSVNADAIYFSSGRKDLLDVTIGKTITSHFNLPHRWNELFDKSLVTEWASLTRKLMLQTDGATTLAHVASLYNQPKILLKLPIHLYGAGGEFAKSLYVDLDFYLARQNVGRLADYLINFYEVKKKRVLTNEAAFQIGRANLRCEILELAQEGFQNTDLLMAYFAFVRFPRWAGANIKNVAPYADVYAPLCTRTFAEAAFSMAPIRRYCHSLHYKLIEHCLPQLHNLPIEHPFRTQRLDKNIAKLVYYGVKKKYEDVLGALRKKNNFNPPKPRSRQHQRMKWLYENLGQMRQTCLDQSESIVWDFIKRDEFEKVTAPSADMAHIGYHQRELFILFTLFSYAASADCQACTSKIR